MLLSSPLPNPPIVAATQWSDAKVHQVDRTLSLSLYVSGRKESTRLDRGQGRRRM